MNEHDSSNVNRRSSRRRSPKGRVRAVCQRGALDLGPNLSLAVLDLSETGICLRLKEPLRLGQEVSISLEGPASVRPVRRVGTIIWFTPSPDGGECRVGVIFQKRLEYRDFLELT